MKQLVLSSDVRKTPAYKFFMQLTLDALETKYQKVLQSYRAMCVKPGNPFGLTPADADSFGAAFNRAKEDLTDDLRVGRTWR